MSNLISQRRGSAASSVSVTISIEQTTSTLEHSLPSLPLDSDVPIKSSVTRVDPFAGGRNNLSSPLPRSIESPPPPYTFPASTVGTTSITPLSFYPFSTLTPLQSTSSLPINSSSSSIPPGEQHRTPSSQEESQLPPSYRDVPQTLSETMFVWGFIFPFLWIVGTTRLWYSSRPVGFAGEEGETTKRGTTVEFDLERGMVAPPSIEESLKLWRQEERLWASRCLWAWMGFVSVGIVVGIMVCAILGKF